MVKSTNKTNGIVRAADKAPAAPWIYINDSTQGGYVAKALAKLIPNSFTVTAFHKQNRLEFADSLSKASDGIKIIQDTRGDHEHKAKKDDIRIVQKGAIKAGGNFVCINLINDPLLSQTYITPGNAHHLNLVAGPGSADAIYKWLFTCLTVRESLYLIPDADMQEIDTVLFPDYKYCSIADAHTQPKDAKIQFVTIILSKPQIAEKNKVVWTVADKTGIANFYYQHRGEQCQYTWDWVMKLQPGDRRALPRMPMIRIKERKQVRVAKAPFRAIGGVILTAGLLLTAIGMGVSKLGMVTKMGSSSKWVSKADVEARGKQVACDAKPQQASAKDRKQVTKVLKVTDEKSEKFWDDAASEASTEAGSESSHDKMKDFV